MESFTKDDLITDPIGASIAARGADDDGERGVISRSTDLARWWKDTLLSVVRSDESDLTNRQMAVLLTVALASGPQTVRGLAQTLRVSKPVITRALNKLANLGYLRRQRDASDGRSVFVELTRSGAAYLDRFIAILTAARTSSGSPFGSGQAA